MMCRFNVALRAAIIAAILILAALSLVPSGSWSATLYATDGTWLWTIDKATGQATPLVAFTGTDPAQLCGIAYDPYDDVLYGVGYDNSGAYCLATIDRSSGVQTFVGYNDPQANLFGLAFDLGTHTLYGVGGKTGYNGACLFVVDTATGAATVVGTGQVERTMLYGLGYDPNSEQLYANGLNLDYGNGLFLVSKTTGLASYIGDDSPPQAGMTQSDLAFDPHTGVMYSLGSISSSTYGLYIVNPVNAAETLVGPYNPSLGASGGLAFVGSDITGVQPVTPAARATLAASPNPTSGPMCLRFVLPTETECELAAYDVAGRLVARMTSGRFGAGPHEVHWDATDAHGARLAAGIYFAVLRAGGMTVARTRLVLVR